MEQQAAGKQQVSSRSAAGQQQQVSSSKQQQVAGKQQGSSAPLKEWSNIFLKINAKKKMNFFQVHGPKTMKLFNY